MRVFLPAPEMTGQESPGRAKGASPSNRPDGQGFGALLETHRPPASLVPGGALGARSAEGQQSGKPVPGPMVQAAGQASDLSEKTGRTRAGETWQDLIGDDDDTPEPDAGPAWQGMPHATGGGEELSADTLSIGAETPLEVLPVESGDGEAVDEQYLLPTGGLDASFPLARAEGSVAPSSSFSDLTETIEAMAVSGEASSVTGADASVMDLAALGLPVSSIEPAATDAEPEVPVISNLVDVARDLKTGEWPGVAALVARLHGNVMAEGPRSYTFPAFVEGLQQTWQGPAGTVAANVPVGGTLEIPSGPGGLGAQTSAGQGTAVGAALAASQATAAQVLSFSDTVSQGSLAVEPDSEGQDIRSATQTTAMETSFAIAAKVNQPGTQSTGKLSQAAFEKIELAMASAAIEERMARAAPVDTSVLQNLTGTIREPSEVQGSVVPNRSEPGNGFAQAMLAQIRKVELSENQTRIALRPRGLGEIEIEVLGGREATTKVVVRVENPAVLSALNESRELLANALRLSDGGQLEFQDWQSGGGSHPERQDEQGIDQLQSSAEPGDPEQTILYSGRLNLIT